MNTFPAGSDQISDTLIAERFQRKVPADFAHPMMYAILIVYDILPNHNLDLKLFKVESKQDIVMTISCDDKHNGFTKEQWIRLRDQFRGYFDLVRFLDPRSMNGVASMSHRKMLHDDAQSVIFNAEDHPDAKYDDVHWKRSSNVQSVQSVQNVQSVHNVQSVQNIQNVLSFPVIQPEDYEYSDSDDEDIGPHPIHPMDHLAAEHVDADIESGNSDYLPVEPLQATKRYKKDPKVIRKERESRTAQKRERKLMPRRSDHDHHIPRAAVELKVENDSDSSVTLLCSVLNLSAE